MDAYENEALRQMYAELRKNLDPSPLAAEMLSSGLLTVNQFDDIAALKKDVDKNEKILESIRKQGRKDVFKTFMRCIEDADPAQKYLADNLKAALEEAKIQVSVQESGDQTEQPQNVQPAQNFEDLTGKPSQVQLLDYVVKKLTTNMTLKSYCLYIGLEDSDYEVAMANNPHSIQSAAMDVVMAWYRGKGKPRKWSTVVSAFQSIGMGDYASELAKKIRSKSI